jgi:ribonuclease T
MSNTSDKQRIAGRFRGFLPVVIDVETGGFNAATDALLEIAAIIIDMEDDGRVVPGDSYHAHVEPFEGANLEESALAFTGIDPFHPFRLAVPESKALETVFTPVRAALKQTGCSRAILVGHNPFFDLGFLNAAVERTVILKNPFHSFSTFDTATLSALAYGQTVLARAVQAAGLEWDSDRAHSALYDCERTAELFCTIMNHWHHLQGNAVDARHAGSRNN